MRHATDDATTPPQGTTAAPECDAASTGPATLDRMLLDAAIESFTVEADGAGAGWTPPTDEVFLDRWRAIVEAATPQLVAYTAGEIVARAGESDRLPSERARRAAFRNTVRARWGDAVAGLEVLILVFEEIGAEHLTRAGEAARGAPSDAARALAEIKCRVLAGLHARACRTAREILALLEDGLADGALARARTLHELAVVGTVLATHGGALAMRYDLHGVVLTAKSMRQFDDHHAALTWEPVEPAWLASAEMQAEALVAYFGPTFEGEFGWAHDTVPRRPKPPRSKRRWDPDAKRGLADLEHAVGLAHFHAFVGWASDHVHTGAPGLHSLGLPLGAATTPYLRGSGYGLADPGQHAALSLRQFAAALGTHVATDAPLDGAVRAGVVRELADRCQAQFIAAHDAPQERPDSAQPTEPA